MDILISVSSFIRYNTTGQYIVDKMVSLTTENVNSTIFTVKEFHSLKIRFDDINYSKLERIVFQTYNNDYMEIPANELPEEIILNDCSEDTSLVPGSYAVEIYTIDDNMYEYYFEILGQHTDSSALNTLRNTVNQYVHGLAINPSMCGQSIMTTIDETDHFLELVTKRWRDVSGLLELIKRNPVETLTKTHVLRSELIRIDPKVIRYRDKHVGSQRVLQPRISGNYDNSDNHAILYALSIFSGQIDSLTKTIEGKLEASKSERAQLNKEKQTKELDKSRIEKGNFDKSEYVSATNALNYTKACIRTNTKQLVHIRTQLGKITMLKNRVMQERNIVEWIFSIKTSGKNYNAPITSVLYKNCIDILTRALDMDDLISIEPHSGFNYKKSELLFEYLGLLKVFNLLIKSGFIPGEDLAAVICNYNIASESRFEFSKENEEIIVLYDTEARSYYPADTYEGLVSENSISRRPDIVLECFIGGEIVGIIIIEAKYRKASYLHNNHIIDSQGMFHRTEVEQTMSDYQSLKYYIPDKKEKEVSAVIVYYPKQPHLVPTNWNKNFGILKKYGHFVAIDISSNIDDNDEFNKLLNKQLKEIFSDGKWIN